MSVSNSVYLIGKLGADPELKFTTGSGIAVATFNLAVERNFIGQNGKKEVDWISIVCWRKLAEHVANNIGKGRLVAVSGSIQTRNYKPQDGGKTVYITEVVADEVKFLDWPKDGNSGYKAGESKGDNSPSDTNDFFPVEDYDIPF